MPRKAEPPLADRLKRWHFKNTDDQGDYCNECHLPWPCRTFTIIRQSEQGSAHAKRRIDARRGRL